jgi:hypothetical protein
LGVAIFDSLRCANRCHFFGWFEGKKSSIESEKELTREMNIDNLEKFAKTSLVAEVILERLVKIQTTSQKEVERGI